MRADAPGRLFYVMGASGVGKDSLLAFVRQAGDPKYVAVAHRYITRPAKAGGENHIALSEEEFQARLSVGWFAMHWRSHRLLYGIGREIDHWRQSGINVVVNGSREYLPAAVEIYPEIVPVLITAEADLIAARLTSRKRESKDQIAERLRHQVDLKTTHASLITINNNGALEVAGASLLAQILRAGDSAKIDAPGTQLLSR